MRKVFVFLFLALFLTGCGLFQPKSEPQVRIEHVLIAPADNLLVDCDIAPPPSKADYLKSQDVVASLSIGEPNPVKVLDVNEYPAVQALRRALKNSETQLFLQSQLNRKHYENQHVCNQRWANLREWKANAEKALINRKKE